MLSSSCQTLKLTGLHDFLPNENGGFCCFFILVASVIMKEYLPNNGD